MCNLAILSLEISIQLFFFPYIYFLVIVLFVLMLSVLLLAYEISPSLLF